MATVKPWIWRNVQKLSLSLSIPGSDSRRVESLVWGDAAFELEMASHSPRYLKWSPLDTPTAMQELRRQRRSQPAGAAIKPWLCTEVSKRRRELYKLCISTPKAFYRKFPSIQKEEKQKVVLAQWKPATASSKLLSTEEENITFHSQALYRFTGLQVYQCWDIVLVVTVLLYLLVFRFTCCCVCFLDKLHFFNELERSLVQQQVTVGWCVTELHFPPFFTNIIITITTTSPASPLPSLYQHHHHHPPF